MALSAQPKPGSFKQTWEKGPKWLHNAVIYQIYPSSYKDSDGNGIGDLPGVISKLDYIKSLGVTAIWFNPVFHSAWVDGGYDIIDFYKIDPRFGTNSDLVTLVNEAHKRGIKVLLDLVAGHTSNLHPWFKQSEQQDPNLQYSHYYIWSNELAPKDQALLDEMLKDPNYMQSTVGKWMKSDAPRAKYYMKNFYACQPALNYGYANPDPNHPWEEPVDAPGPRAVRQELKDILDFWYSKGVDGFRVDMAASLVKNDKDKQAIMSLWREIREWMDRTHPERVLVAEWGKPEYCLASGFNIDMDLNGARARNRQMYYDKKHQAEGGTYFALDGFQPSVKDLYGNPWPENKIDRKETAESVLNKYYDNFSRALERTKDWGYFATISGNHDHLRLNTGSRNTPEQLKVMLTFVLSMPLPILYYGDEIGMKSLVALPSVEGSNHNGKERSGGRTPMQWDSSKNAGFSTAPEEKLYLPVCPEWTPVYNYLDYLEWKKNGCKNPTSKGYITVESQKDDPQSLLNYTKELIRVHTTIDALGADGKWEPIRTSGQPYPMVYLRSDDKETYLVAMNPTKDKLKLALGNRAEKSLASKKGLLTPLVGCGKTSYTLTKKGDVLDMGPVSAVIVRIK
ncbi:MAG: alpha-amylase [Alistipes sp.]|nr:alpha-amylase [Candidatus Alistipes equi]